MNKVVIISGMAGEGKTSRIIEEAMNHIVEGDVMYLSSTVDFVSLSCIAKEHHNYHFIKRGFRLGHKNERNLNDAVNFIEHDFTHSIIVLDGLVRTLNEVNNLIQIAERCSKTLLISLQIGEDF